MANGKITTEDLSLFREATPNLFRPEEEGAKPLSVLREGEQPEPEGFSIPEEDIKERNKAISEHYEAIRGEAFDRRDFLPPVDDARNPIVDLANIFLHDEMASVGISLDQENLGWSYEKFKDAWTEHPIRSSIAVALGLAPALGAAYKASKVAKFANIADSDLIKRGLLSPGANTANMPHASKRLLQQQAYTLQRAQELQKKWDIYQTNPTSPEAANFAERQIYAFNKRFGNTFIENVNPSTPTSRRLDHIDKMNEVIEGAEVHKYLASMPGPEVGASITKYFLDPTKLKGVPKEYRSWAINMASDLKQTQRKAWEEGFINDETYQAIGDIWFPAYRRGSQLAEESPFTKVFTTTVRGGRGKLKVLNIPRTTSPSLLPRQTSKGELMTMLDRTEAVDLLKANKGREALRLLKGEENADLRRIIDDGDFDTAITRLSGQPLLDVTPEALTVKGLLQQKLLFENFRYLRDISMDEGYTLASSRFRMLSPRQQGEWRRLDELPNSSIVRRMVGKKTGTMPAELGYVHRDLFRELTDLSSGQPGIASRTAELMEFATILHKTSRTALNPFTHGQNIAGNFMFLAWAGMNPFSRESFDLLRKSTKAVRTFQTERRAGKLVEDIDDLGEIPSYISGQPSINLADEMKLQPVKELIEESSLVASEGLGSLERLAAKSKDTQTFMNNLIRFTQRSARAKVLPPTGGILPRSAEEAS
ncbi:MAG: hypothetical protein ACXAEN_23450, partial [Candidatus Thorarchaeota archaeon]